MEEIKLVDSTPPQPKHEWNIISTPSSQQPPMVNCETFEAYTKKEQQLSKSKVSHILPLLKLKDDSSIKIQSGDELLTKTARPEQVKETWILMSNDSSTEHKKA